MCLGGPRAQKATEQALAGIASDFRLRQIKFDGIWLSCNEKNHGHQPGDLSCEAMAEGMISILKKVRLAAPDVWLESVSFGVNASPWWLLYFNSQSGLFSQEAPWGRVPCPVYRESYTTARDYYNLQGAHGIKTIPISAQEVLGFIHQSPEAPMNDAVMTLMRGHMFLPVYIHPKFMNEARWKDVADFFKWARKNAPLLEETEPIPPAAWAMGKTPQYSNDSPMPREPYGYAHFGGKVGLVALRNPWIEPAAYALKLDDAIGVPSQAKGLTAVSLYPEARVYGKCLGFGDTLNLRLAPYETLVLAFTVKPDSAAARLPQADQALGNPVQVASRQSKAVPARAGSGKDPSVVIEFKGQVKIESPQAAFLILTEHDHPTTATLHGGLKVDGMPASLKIASASQTGWASAADARPEHWVFQSAPLAPGEHTLALTLASDRSTSASQVSLWVWATKSGMEGKMARYPNTLPRPELISLGSACLMEPVKLEAIPASMAKR